VLAALSSSEAQSVMANRPALGVLPGTDWPGKLSSLMNKMMPRYNDFEGTVCDEAPSDLWDITTMACGSTANENAFKAVFIKYVPERRE